MSIINKYKQKKLNVVYMRGVPEKKKTTNFFSLMKPVLVELFLPRVFLFHNS